MFPPFVTGKPQLKKKSKMKNTGGFARKAYTSSLLENLSNKNCKRKIKDGGKIIITKIK